MTHPTMRQYQLAAHRLAASEHAPDELTVDNDATVCRTEGGAWVQALGVGATRTGDAGTYRAQSTRDAPRCCMNHTKYVCKCGRFGCQFCDGDLFHCTVCHGFEGSLPTDCPGARMDEHTQNRVYAGEIDYRNGRGWITPDGTGKSMGDVNVLVAQRQERGA